MTAEADAPVVEYDVKDDIAFIRLNRPQVGNAMNQEFGDAILAIATELAGDRSVRAVLITGNGPVFSVGGDIAAFNEASPDQMAETLTRMAIPYHEALRLLSRLEVPIVTAVHGACAGGGLSLLYIADIAIAAQGTKFATGFGRIGISSDAGNSWYLPRLIGHRRAAEMFFEDRVIYADTAAEWGLVTRTVPADELAEAADTAVRRLAAGPTRAYGEMRRLLRDSGNSTYFEQLAAETDALRRTARTADATGAIADFMAKRRPTFEGQ
ncbi:MULTISPECIES: enoyl-CoA hydratase/isomerase family protein [unclassified Nocardia]|uniref:enoyl-CoA hydratase/isomerase family protein n=1 Tax=unclassified Nocardia TaxID=2637762 RepID=UPI0035D59826